MLLCKDCVYNNNCNIQEVEPDTVGCAGLGKRKEQFTEKIEEEKNETD